MGDGRGAAESAIVRIPAGDAVLGADRRAVPFGWDNEFEAHRVHVPAFEIDALPVTNAQFLEFVEAGGYANRDLWEDEGWEWLQAERVAHPAFWLPADPSSIAHRPSSIADRPSNGWWWRGMFAPIDLPLDRPVYVSHAEATAYARWKGRRLMTEPEFHRAAYGSPEDMNAAETGWRSEHPPAGFYDFAGFDPVTAGSFPPSPSGVYDLIGNGWEWTSTVFGPFNGFEPMPSYPEYSADFFDGRHYVLKGASPATARELVRPSFRNWFRGNYPYVYAKFRTAR